MKIRHLILVFLTALSAHGAYTYNLTSVSQDAFEDCYYRGKVGGSFVKYVEAGDTIVLPAGSATWGNSSRNNEGVVYIILPITVKGQGDSTVITMDETGKTYANGVIALWASAVWKDMKFKGAGDLPVTVFNIGANNVRITNVTYEGQPDLVPNNGQTGDGYFVFSQGYTGILIDHCRISGQLGSHEWIFTRGPTNSWQTNHSLGGSAVDVFIEDCTFSGVGYSDANANARHVIRFNTITGNIKFDGHGNASNSPARSVRQMEIYNNTWTNGSMASAAAIELRGGTAMVFNNTASTGLIMLRDYSYDNTWPNIGHFNISITAGSPVTIVTQSPHGYETGWPVFIDCGAQGLYGFFNVTKINATTFSVVKPDATSGTGWNVRRFFTAYDYPISDQFGNGKDGAAREPGYLWGNTQGGSAWARALSTPNAGAQTLYQAQTGNATATFTERDVIQANRDFFATAGFDTTTGVSVGTRAQMNGMTPSIIGYGFWVTDEGSWNTKLPPNTSGRLYRWSGSAWVLHYTPYTYPHPMQTSTEVAQPSASPSAGTFEYPQTVALTIYPLDATVRYTTDGSTPSTTVGTIYTTPISVSSTTTIKSIGYKTGLNDSPVLEGLYTITGQVFTPTSNKLTADYHGDQSVSLACSTSGSVIHYTTDGSTPTAGSPIYSGPLTVTTTTTIKAIGTKAGLADSSVLTIGITILLEMENYDPILSTQPIDKNSRSGYAYFTASVTGTLAQISLYGTNTSATQDIEFGLYRDATGNNSGGLTKIPGTPSQFPDVGTWSASWKNFAVNFPVVAGERYWIFVQTSENTLSLGAQYVGGIGDRWNSGGSYGTAWGDIGATTNRDGWKFNVKGTLVQNGTTPPPSQVPLKAPQSVQVNKVVEQPK